MNVEQCPYRETKCQDLICPCAKFTAYIDVQDPKIVNEELEQLGITSDMNKWGKIYNMQKHFAERFHTTKDITKDLTDHWVKEYAICIEDEIGEIFDYIKLADEQRVSKTDSKELKKEVIDVLHFVMDVMIASGIDSHNLLNKYITQYNITLKNDILDDIFQFAKSENDRIYSAVNPNAALITLVIRLLLVNRELRQQISWKHWKKPNDSINYEKLNDVCVMLFHRFMLISAYLFNNADEMINMYIIKNVENIRRQKHGY